MNLFSSLRKSWKKVIQNINYFSGTTVPDCPFQRLSLPFPSDILSDVPWQKFKELLFDIAGTMVPVQGLLMIDWDHGPTLPEIKAMEVIMSERRSPFWSDHTSPSD